MKLTVNSRQVGRSPEDGETLDSLLTALRKRGEIRPDQVVVELRVDRHRWQAGDMARLKTVSLKELDEVAITTTGMRDYAARILMDARGMLAVIREAVEPVAARFREGSPEEANAELFRLLDAFQAFVACLWNVRNSCDVSAGPAEAARSAFTPVADALDAIADSQERGDWAELASLLIGRFLPALGGFEPVLDQMVADLQDGSD